MTSTFAGLTLFNSGPHRFTVGRLGRYVRGPFQTALELPQSTDEGPAELAIIQTGRLVATSSSALWSLVDAIRAQTETPRTGTLIDNTGRSWPGVTLHRFEPEDRLDRGRVWSLGYRALYLDFAGA